MPANLMNNVKVKKDELLTTLKVNLATHRLDTEEALAARRVEIQEYLEQVVEKMGTDKEYQPKENIKFPMPKDNSADYSRAIRMVEMTVDEIIELTEDQFDKLVMDNWYWKEDFLRTTSLYGKFK